MLLQGTWCNVQNWADFHNLQELYRIFSNFREDYRGGERCVFFEWGGGGGWLEGTWIFWNFQNEFDVRKLGVNEKKFGGSFLDWPTFQSVTGAMVACGVQSIFELPPANIICLKYPFKWWVSSNLWRRHHTISSHTATTHGSSHTISTHWSSHVANWKRA